MEEQRRECDKRRVMLPRVGGGGGPVTLIVWGGALAVAGLVAAFSVKKRRNSILKEEEETARSSRKEEEKSDGLRFVLHQSSSPNLSLNPCSVSCETPPKIGITQIDDCITGNLIDMGIMEAKDASSGEYQEFLLSDSERESIVISNDGDGDGDGDAEKEFSVPILENMAVDEPEKFINITSMAPSNMKIEVEAVTAEWIMIEEGMTEKTSFSSASSMEDDEEAVTAEEETSEHSPSSTEGVEEIEEEMSMESQLLGEQENHNRTESSLSSSESDECWPNQPASTDEEEVTEGSEESSEEGGSSTETNEAIWPAEIIDASSAGHRKTIINYQNSGERFEQRDRNTAEVQELLSNSQQSSDCYRLDNENRETSRTNNKEAQELVVVVHEGKHLIRWQIALCSVVLPLLLLLLAHWIMTPKYSF